MTTVAGDVPTLLVDLQAAQSLAHGDRGIARYALDLTDALARAGAPIGAVLCNPALDTAPALVALARRHGLPLVPAGAAALRAARARAAGPVALVVLSPMEQQVRPLRTHSRALLGGADLVVSMLYDLIPLRFPDRYLRGPGARGYRVRTGLVAHADLVLTDSDSARADAIELLGLRPDRVVTVGGGVSAQFCPPRPGADPAAEVRARFGAIGQPYVLCVSGYEWRKNTESLIRAFARLPGERRAATQLVVACNLPPEGRAAWTAVARDAGLADDRLVLTGRVTDDDLVALYRGTSLFCFASRYEGYGLPILEAMACGAPAVCADNSSLRELVDEPAARFDADDLDAMAEVLERGLGDEAFRARLAAIRGRALATQTWDAAAARTLDAIAGAARRLAPHRPRTPALRVGLVGPLPPDPSGIATYDERLVRALAARDDVAVTAWVDGRASRSPALRGVVHQYPAAALGDRFDERDDDVSLLVLGNSPSHVHALDRARLGPGRAVVWLHEIDLVGAHLAWAHRRAQCAPEGDPGNSDPARVLVAAIADAYGDKVAAAVRTAGGAIDHDTIRSLGLRLAAPVVRRAAAVVVGSHHARELLEADLDLAGVPAGERPPVHVVGLAVPPVRVGPVHDADPTRARRHGGACVVVSFGVVDALKRPDVLVAALALLPAAQLVLVGACTDDERARLDAVAARAGAGVGARLTITGRLDDDEYAAWFDRADVAVQLRASSSGESSAAVADALAAGLPVVTDIASAAELPTDAVVALAPGSPAETVAAAIRGVLDEPDGAARRRDAARSYARSRTFDDVAGELVAILTSIAGR